MRERNTDEKERLPRRYPFIAVVGPVGVGKTTFTELLTNGTGATKLQEPYLDNPYLKYFYTKDPIDFSFDSQMFFLANDGLSARRIPEFSKRGPVFKDAGREMNSIIERVQWKMGWIKDDDHERYISAGNNAYKDCLKPDVHIALKAKEETVIRRILERGAKEKGREMELAMHKKYPKYFPTLVTEFNSWLEEKQRDCNSCVTVIDTDKFDFARDGSQMEEVVTEAKNWLSYYISNPNQRNQVGSDGAKLIMPDSFTTRPHIIDRVPGVKIDY